MFLLELGNVIDDILHSSFMTVLESMGKNRCEMCEKSLHFGNIKLLYETAVHASPNLKIKYKKFKQAKEFLGCP